MAERKKSLVSEVKKPKAFGGSSDDGAKGSAR
jgi:hypothetical protein